MRLAIEEIAVSFLPQPTQLIYGYDWLGMVQRHDADMLLGREQLGFGGGFVFFHNSNWLIYLSVLEILLMRRDFIACVRSAKSCPTSVKESSPTVAAP